MAESVASHASSPPPSLAKGLVPNLRFDLLAGFLVFLIAMPLCLAIAKASNFPPIAGIWTAVIGGILTTFLSNANLTIKGPAAGMIVIVAGAVTDLGKEFYPALPDDVVISLKAEGKNDERIAKELEFRQLAVGHRLALGVGIVAGLIQIAFGLLRAGKLGDFFPLAAVHGMLAAIGIIIIIKSGYTMLGVAPTKGAGPLELLAEFPGKIPSFNPEIACIGLISLAILFGIPLIPFQWARKIPAPLVVLAVAIPLGSAMLFDLDHEHVYPFHDGFFETVDHDYKVGPEFLVEMPNVLENPSDAFFMPDFRGVFTFGGWIHIAMFAIIASLESLLSAKAIDLIDPWKRRTNMNRDLLACGVANAATASIGALPMISEIVRSKANVDSGGRTRFANLFHGLFLLGFVLLVPHLIHRIPLAALAAMLVYTGYRLAHPREFVQTFKIGWEQLVVFVSTIVATLATDLLIGIAVGIAVKLVLHVINGVPITKLFVARVEQVEVTDEKVVIAVHGCAVFSNWLALKSKVLDNAGQKHEVIIDMSDCSFIDHSAMEKLHELERQFQEDGRHLHVIGMENFTPLSKHPLGARKQVKRSMATSDSDR